MNKRRGKAFPKGHKFAKGGKRPRDGRPINEAIATKKAELEAKEQELDIAKDVWERAIRSREKELADKYVKRSLEMMRCSETFDAHEYPTRRVTRTPRTNRRSFTSILTLIRPGTRLGLKNDAPIAPGLTISPRPRLVPSLTFTAYDPSADDGAR